MFIFGRRVDFHKKKHDVTVFLCFLFFFYVCSHHSTVMKTPGLLPTTDVVSVLHVRHPRRFCSEDLFVITGIDERRFQSILNCLIIFKPFLSKSLYFLNYYLIRCFQNTISLKNKTNVESFTSWIDVTLLLVLHCSVWGTFVLCWNIRKMIAMLTIGSIKDFKWRKINFYIGYIPLKGPICSLRLI